MKKIIASFVATLLIFATAQSSFAQSGTFGELSWSIANNTLTIGVTADTGSAPMNNDWAPWSRYADSSISTIIIEDRVTTIAAQAFVNFTELTTVVIGNSVTIIGFAAFAYTPLTSVTFGKNVEIIENAAFFGTKLRFLVLPNSVTSIGMQAFQQSPELTAVTIPSSVTSIGTQAFAFNPALASVTVEWDQPLGIPAFVFFGISANARLNVPAGLENLYRNAPVWGNFLIGNDNPNVWRIGSPNMADVTAVLSGNTLTIRGTGNMMHFGFAQDMTLEYNVTTAPWRGASTTLETVIIDNGVTSVGVMAFLGCVGLTSVILPNRLETIGGSAFSNTGLTSVTIPSSVTTIGIAAFQNSPNLESVISLNPTPPMLGSNVFLGIPNDACVFVPESSLNAYQTADGWSEFLCLQASFFHTVTFSSQGGSDVESQTVEHGETAERPISPRRRNYTFEGWYIDTTFATAWDFATDVVVSDMTLFAKWTFNGATNIVETHEPASLQAFPNPFINEIHIADAEDFSLQVLTQTGIIVHTQQITKPLETVNLQGLPAGIYILRLEKNGEVRTARIVKQ